MGEDIRKKFETRKFNPYWEDKPKVQESPKEPESSFLDNFLTEANKISGVVQALNPFTALQYQSQHPDFIKEVGAPLVESIGGQFKAGISKLPTNPIAGSLQIGNSLLGLVSSPFTILDQTLKYHGFETVANTISYPFEKIAEGVSEGTKLIDAVLPGTREQKNEALRLAMISNGLPPETAYSFDNQKLDEISTQLNSLNQGLAQFLVPMIGGKVKSALKEKFKKPPEVNINPYAGENVEPPYKPSGDEPSNINVGDVGLDRLTDLPDKKAELIQKLKDRENKKKEDRANKKKENLNKIKELSTKKNETTPTEVKPIDNNTEAIKNLTDLNKTPEEISKVLDVPVEEVEKVVTETKIEPVSKKEEVRPVKEIKVQEVNSKSDYLKIYNIVGDGEKIGEFWLDKREDAYYTTNVSIVSGEQRQGNGYNAYKQLINELDKPLRSDLLNDRTRSIWDKLVSNNLAKKIGEDKYESISTPKVEKQPYEMSRKEYIGDSRYIESKSNEHLQSVATAINEGKITSHPDYPELTAKTEPTPLTGTGKGEETTPLFNQKSEVKGQENLFDKGIKAETSESPINKLSNIDAKIADTKAKLKQANINSLKRLQAGIDPEQVKLMAELIGHYAAKGIVKFDEVMREVVKEVGDWAKPYVIKAWEQAQREKRNDKTTGIKNAIVDQERIDRGLTPLETSMRRDWGSVWDEAERKIRSGEVNPTKLTKELLDNPRPTRDYENAILTYEKQRIIEEHSVLLDEVSKSGGDITKHTGLLKLEEALNEIDLVTKQTGSDTARSLAIRRMEIKDDYTIAPLIQRARIANKGQAIPDKVKIELARLSEQVKNAEAKVKQYEDKISQMESEKFVKRIDSEEKTKSEKRVQKKADLDSEYNDLIKEFAKTVKLNVLVDPKQIQILVKAAKNRVQRGYVSAEEIVSQIYESVKDYMPGLTKREVRDAISGYGKYTKLSKNEIDVEFRDIKKQLRLLSALEDVENKIRPLKSGFERDVLSKQSSELQKQLTKAMKEAGFKDVSVETMQKSYRTRLENRKAELQTMLDTGNFTKTPKRKTPLDPALSKLKDEVDLLKIKADKEIRLLELKNRSNYQKITDTIINTTGSFKSLKSSIDLSAPFRQGLVLVTGHPVLAFKEGGAFREMFRYFKSDKALRELKRQIEESPNAALYNKSGLYLANEKTNLNKVLGREEAFQSTIAEKIPFVSNSERAYVGFLDKLRMDVFDFQAEQLKKTGFSFEKDPAIFKALGDMINTATGRGTLGGFERSATTLSSLFFSPRLIASRLKLMNPVYYLKLPKPVRLMIMKDMLKFVGVGTTIVSLAKLAGADVETDPRSSDFAKVKINNTRLDVWGGFQQYGVFFSRIITNETKTQKGVTKSLGGFNNRFDLSVRFLSGKFSPFAGFVRDYLNGKNFEGEPFSLGKEGLDLITPLYAKDFYEAVKLDGVEGGLAVLPGIFGVGTQTYEAKPSKPGSPNPFKPSQFKSNSFR